MKIYKVEPVRVKKQESNDIRNIKNAFNDFKGMLLNYVNNKYKCNDLDMLRTAFKIITLDEIHQCLFMIYIFSQWHAYTMDIIEGKYAYINYTTTVWDSFIEHMAH